MRRGFKAWCERTAGDYRKSLGLQLDVALDPHALAKLLGVRVVTPSDIPGLSDSSLQQLTVTDSSSWSAVTISRNGVVLVILNSGQSVRRQTNSLGHELSHIILNHTSDDAQLSRQGFLFRGRFSKEQEEEADWLTGCLLVPGDGLLRAYRRTSSSSLLANRFGVSEALVNWRIRMTGIHKRMRSRARIGRVQHQ